MSSVRSSLAIVGAGLALLIGAAQPAVAQEKFTLRFNHVLVLTEPFHEGFVNWGKRVEERTKGGLRIQVFHSSQLGVEEDIIEQMRQGANVGQNTDAARLSTYVPGFAVVNAPYFLDTIADVGRLATAPSIVKWQDELASGHGLKVVCFNWVQGFRNFFTNKPIRAPTDLAGLRIRTPGAPIWQKSIEALGATPVAMPFGDMYPALQQNTINGVELVYNNIPGGRLYEVLKFAAETRHILLVNFEVVSAKFFDRLPKDFQSALTEECTKAGAETSARIADLTAQIKRDLEARGMTVVQDVDLAAFRQSGEKAYQALNLTEPRNTLHKEIGK